MESLTEAQNTALGIASGMIDVSALHWMNTTKNLVQVGTPITWHPSVLYRGYFANCVNMVACTGVQFAADGALKRQLGGGGEGQADEKSLSSTVHLLSAVGAGALSGVVGAPIELVMIQQQRFGGNVMPTLRAAYAGGLMRGLVMASVREGIFTGGYLGLCPVITYQLEAQGLHAEAAATSGAVVAGLLSSTLSHPADTIKTRIQGSSLSERAPSMLWTLRSAWQEGGLRVLYAGFGWRCARNIATFFLLDHSRNFLAPLIFGHSQDHYIHNLSLHTFAAKSEFV